MKLKHDLIAATLALAGLAGLTTVADTAASPDPTPSTAPAARPAPLPAPPLALASRTLPPPNPYACDWTAVALLESSRHAIVADFWLGAGNCLNDTGTPFGSCFQDLLDELAEEMDLAEDQFDARIDLCNELGHGPYDPGVDPNDFSVNVTNTHFPLVPGQVRIYRKMTPEGLEEVTITVLMDTVEIEGVTCRQVNDVETLNGSVVEDTIDWYAQKSDGSVWYLGEISKNYDEDGFLEDIDGSWRHGADGAKAGVIMLANPTVGTKYRNEYFLNEAEDIGEVISLGMTVTVPAGTYTNCVEIEDTTPIEPDARERKFFAPGVGLVKEVDLETGETLELFQIIP